jgi:hypothetical protein
MKRDWDLLRQQLTIIENDQDLFANHPHEPKWTTQSEAEYLQQLNDFQAFESKVFGHLELLIDNRYIEGIQIIRSLNGQYHYANSHPRLTMAGHDLLDTMRSSTLWESIKETAKSKGIELTFDAIKALGQLGLKQLLG